MVLCCKESSSNVIEPTSISTAPTSPPTPPTHPEPHEEEDIKAFLNRRKKGPQDDSHERRRSSRMSIKFHPNQKEFVKSDDIARIPLNPDENVVMTKDYVTPVIEKSKESSNLIMNALSTGLFFEDMAVNARKRLMVAMEEDYIEIGTEIIKEGTKGDYFYVLEKGKVEFYSGEKQIGQVKEGEYFGELSFFSRIETGEEKTTVAVTNCKVWKLHRKIIKSILLTTSTKNMEKSVYLLQRIDYLSKLDRVFLNKIAKALEEKTFKQGEIIFKKGSHGDTFYIVYKGTVSLTNVGAGNMKYDDMDLERGSHFGDMAIIRDEVRGVDATAKTDCTLWALTRDQFTDLLGPLQDAIQTSFNKTKLMTVPSIADSKPTEAEMISLARKLKKVEYEEGKILFFEGEAITDRCLYLVHDGVMNFTSAENKDHTLKNNDFFGESYLNGTRRTYNYTVTSGGSKDKNTGEIKPAVCYVLSEKAIASVLGNVNRLGKRNSTRMARMVYTSFNHMINVQNRLSGQTMSLNQLSVKKLIGRGSYGDVYRVKVKETGELLALKVQKKKQLLKSNSVVKTIMNERKIMAMFDHPFIIGLKYSFQDSTRLFLLFKLYTGGDLYILRKVEWGGGKLPLDMVIFYSAIIFQALDFLHCRNIIHRDLKPDNVMLDARGYCVLIDLGMAKEIDEFTTTHCGTPVYSSPEKILHRPYDKSDDLWALGVMMYEMIHGKLPFKKNREEHIRALYFQIVKKTDLVYDTTEEAKDIVSRLLIKKASFRLGCLAGGADEIREHKFFESIDFDDLMHKKIEPPYVPGWIDFTEEKECEECEIEEGGSILPVQQHRFNGY